MAGEDKRELTRERDEPVDEADAPLEADVSEDTDEEGALSEGAQKLDAAADSFLEVEQKLDTMADGMQVRGQAIDVEQIPAEEVPDGFPYDVGTEDALALTLEIDQTEGKTATTYFAWPEEGADERLGRLLQLRDVPLDRFADLHGADILLEVEDGHFVPVLPREEPRGTDRAYLGVLGGFAFLLVPLLAWLLGITGMVGSSTFLLLFFLVHLVVLPVSLYLDAWNLRSTTNWEGGPLFWAFFSMIPGLNVMTVAAYLVLRQNAEPII